jgi:RNA polymerase sigma factor (sigma-70 family)
VTLAFVDDSGAGEPDAAVLQRLRRGDTDAYAVLYGRHAGRARRLAGSLLGNAADVDDVVAEVFSASFRAIRRGKGPADDFGPYVLRAVRRECARSWRRRAHRRESPSDDLDVVDDEQHDFEERVVLQQAFNALPSHLRQVLWMTEVERLSHAEVAERTTSTSQAVAAMAMRARNALAEQYLAAHVAPSTPPECARVRRTLARTVRGTASRRQQRRVADHLACCHECAQAERQLRLVNRRLRTLAPPALAGALVVPRLVSIGLRGRVAAWLLGPATAPVVAVTGLLATGIALPAATSQAERPPAVAADVGADDPVHEGEAAGTTQRTAAGASGRDGSASGSASNSSGAGDPTAVDATSGSAATAPGPGTVGTLAAGTAAPTPSTLPVGTLPTTPNVAAPAPEAAPDLGLDVGLDTGIGEVGAGVGVGADLDTGQADVGVDVSGVPLPEASLQAEVTVPPLVGSLPIVSDVLPPSDEPVLDVGVETGDDGLDADVGVDAPVEEVTEVVEPVVEPVVETVVDPVGGLLGGP